MTFPVPMDMREPTVPRRCNGAARDNIDWEAHTTRAMIMPLRPRIASKLQILRGLERGDALLRPAVL